MYIGDGGTVQPAALIIDDDDYVRESLGRILRRAGFVVTSCSTAAEGLARIEDGERFNLVVSDMQMPEMDGAAFRERALVAWPELDAVLAFVSGDAETTWRPKIGAARFFVKPVGRELLAFAAERSEALK
jgi:DNA-binding NtrC family response regulator